jgi:hypothetical protein
VPLESKKPLRRACSWICSWMEALGGVLLTDAKSEWLHRAWAQPHAGLRQRLRL